MASARATALLLFCICCWAASVHADRGTNLIGHEAEQEFCREIGLLASCNFSAAAVSVLSIDGHLPAGRRHFTQLTVEPFRGS